MNQTEAQAACRENYTDLVTVYSDEDSDNMKMKTCVSDGWIGLYRSVFSEKWSNGDPVTFRNLTGDCGTLSYCAAMKADAAWESVQCNMTRYFMCYKQASIHVSDEALSWETALDYCQEGNRAGFLSITSESEQEEVKSELGRRCVSEPVWVGLKQSQLFGFWIWADGNAVFPYSNWDEGKEPEHLLSQHCGAVDPQRDFRWTDMNCRSRYKVLCRMKCSP
ncbi:hypothetical protein AMELA_G00235600 [Ameiurus melas]|uniref:C-type lectin domain-containing protein n=1 Tax=Ameiurus melas TaxID=219545 RepID=A0A7J6A0V5_AMEME|nr:hypothetical protein AMELA_G00235600 [Ameiurus melas]